MILVTAILGVILAVIVLSFTDNLSGRIRGFFDPAPPSGWYGTYVPETNSVYSDQSIWIGPNGIAKVRITSFEMPATWTANSKTLLVSYPDLNRKPKQSRYLIKDSKTLYDIDTNTSLKFFQP